MRRFCVYLHLKPGTQEVFYVGKATGRRNLQRRSLRNEFDRAYAFHAGKGHARSEFWHKFVRKYGVPDVEIIEVFTDLQAALLKERELIVAYGLRRNDTGPLVNLSYGGEGRAGYSVPKENRPKNSPIPVGFVWPREVVERRRQAQIGVKFSGETKEKMSRSSRFNRRTVNLETGVVYRSAKKAAQAMGISPSIACTAMKLFPRRYLKAPKNPVPFVFADEYEVH